MKIILSFLLIVSFIFSTLPIYAATQDPCIIEEGNKSVEVKEVTVRSEFRTENKLVNDYSHLNTPEQASTADIIKSIREKKLTIRSEFRTENKLVNDYSDLNALEKKETTADIIKAIREKKLTIRSEFRTENKLVNDYSHLNTEGSCKTINLD